MTIVRLFRTLGEAMSGQKLRRDLARFERAADDLDAAVREVLER